MFIRKTVKRYKSQTYIRAVLRARHARVDREHSAERHSARRSQ